MKKYFTKYLPVKGEIKEDDNIFYKNNLYIDCIFKIHNSVIEISDDGTFKVNKDECKLAKLFLCSRDIQVGDKVTDGTEQYEIDQQRFDLLDKENGHLRSKIFKVIGEISPNATWVKEGDEFDEIKYACLHINAFGEGSWYDFTEEEFIDRKIKPYPKDAPPMSNPRGMWFKYIKVKCSNCQHFH